MASSATEDAGEARDDLTTKAMLCHGHIHREGGVIIMASARISLIPTCTGLMQHTASRPPPLTPVACPASGAPSPAQAGTAGAARPA